METFLIKSATDEGFLEFSRRNPDDRSRPINDFWIRLVSRNLSAQASVYAGDVTSLATLFEGLAKKWAGWPGEEHWESLEGELSLRCTHDRAGHVAIRIKLRSGSYEADWTIDAVVMTEAGQLEAIARDASDFFGNADS